MSKPHKHSKIIKAWADGAEIEFRTMFKDGTASNWYPAYQPVWDMPVYEFRIKPEPKEDLQYLVQAKIAEGKYLLMNHDIPRNLKIIFDGETGELKSAEVLK